jgi:hypothetical protein
MVTIEAQSRGSVAKGERIEARRIHCTELYDRMHAVGQLSDRQHAAAERYAMLFVAAGLHPRLSADYGSRRAKSHDSGEGVGPLDIYRRAARQSPDSRHIEAMVLGQHPGNAWLEVMQGALDDYARAWSIDEHPIDIGFEID